MGLVLILFIYLITNIYKILDSHLVLLALLLNSKENGKVDTI
jgi:hypothetical protein